MDNRVLWKAGIALLLVMLVFLQASLWFGEGSLAHIAQLERAIAKQVAENAALKARNQELRDEIESLRTDPDAIEEIARRDLGMIREGETYYMLVDPPKRESSR